MALDALRWAWVARRNRLLASPAFQRFAARFPLTRPIARRRARALFDLVAGFTYSQTLYACVASGLLDRLDGEPANSAALADHIDLPGDGIERLLRAAAALGLVERVGDCWTLGPAGAAMAGSPGLGAMVAHHHTLYADLAEPLTLFRRGGGGALSRFWRYAESPGTGSAEQVAAYSQLMAASQPLVAEQALAAYDFGRHRRILDVGGGEGAFLAAVGRAVPGPDLGLFDLPAVVARAEHVLSAAGLGARTRYYPGDFLRDALPGGHDLITLVRIMHDHDDAPALALLRAVRAALPPGGRLLIVEPLAGTPGAEPVGAYFTLYLLAMGSGRPRSASELRAMLTTAGFARVCQLANPLPMSAGVILAKA